MASKVNVPSIDETADSLVQIDGSFGEGGGQIIRTSVSLASVTGRPVEITNIRARRSKPGLHAQHLTAVRAAAALCNAELKGADLGSQFLRFTPTGRSSAREFAFDVGTAGATALVAQTLMVPMLFLPGESTVARVRGGTHVPMSPPADYVEAVYSPALHQMGANVHFGYTRAGFFPKGGGEIEISRGASRLEPPIDRTDRGRLKRLRLFVVTCQLPVHVATRGIDALLKELKGYGVPVSVENRAMEGNSPGAAIVLTAECENGGGGFTSLGERGKPIERVAAEALRDYQKWFASGAAVDEHLADQLVLPAALVHGESRWTTPTITEHLRTVLEVASLFLPITYSLEELSDGSGMVSLTGVGAGRYR